MQRKYYRRVYRWDNGSWTVAVNDWVYAWSAFECQFGVGWCNFPEPYIYEQWWSYTAGTWGSEGSFSYLGARINWGANPVINP